MIESIKIKGAATFQGDEQTIDGLSKVNFIYGCNGSGKTTISRIIANPQNYASCAVNWKSGNALCPVVYNRDFVEMNFNQSPDLKGIFTLGEGVGIKEKIDAAIIELNTLRKKWDSLNLQLQGQNGEGGKIADKKDLDEKLKKRCWEQKKKFNGNKLQEALKGSLNSEEKFKDKILAELEINTAPPLPLEELEKKAETVFGETPVTEDLIPVLSFDSLIVHQNNAILAKRVIGKMDVDIAAMIKKLGNSDWVREGKGFYDVNDNICPFCQQTTEESFAKSLNEYFDEAFEVDKKEINNLFDNYKTDSERLQQQIASLLEKPSKFLDIEKLKLEKELFVSKIILNLQRIAEKKKEPSQIFALEAMNNICAAITFLIEEANSKITAHNILVENLGSAQATLKNQAWRFLLEELKDCLTQYKQDSEKVTKDIQNIEAALEQCKKEGKAKKLEIEALEKQSTSIQPTLDAINSLLKSFDFYSFSLAKAEDGISYKLVRLDGSDAKETLSEGEKSFLTFLYFYYLLSGSTVTSGITVDRVVVIDDPVSSLDSDVLFIISSLIKNIFNDIKDGAGYIKQVFVLTHNVYFHKEVSYGIDKITSHTYWIVKKPQAISQIIKHDKNPINTAYELLWYDIRKSDVVDNAIQNKMRRVLEHYFKILGDVPLDDICKEFTGKDKIICNSLLSWAHTGSHIIPDDLFVSDHNIATESYKRVFRQIFEKYSHGAHYKMMMKEDFEEQSIVEATQEKAA